jgi:hypothetical protein
MNRMKAPGNFETCASTAIGMVSFKTPVNRKRAATTTWTIHSSMLRRREGRPLESGLIPDMMVSPPWPWFGARFRLS